MQKPCVMPAGPSYEMHTKDNKYQLVLLNIPVCGQLTLILIILEDTPDASCLFNLFNSKPKEGTLI